MDKAFNPLFQLYESAEIGELRDFAFYNVVDVIFFLKVHPRIFREMLERKVDALLGRIHADNLKLDLLSFLYEILRTGNMAPTHIVDMKQSVESTKVDERTEA